MNSIIDSIDSQVVLGIAAIAVAFLMLRLLLRILNVGLGMILTIAAIVLVLQYVFGISPKELWYAIGHLPQDFAQLLQGFR